MILYQSDLMSGTSEQDAEGKVTPRLCITSVAELHALVDSAATSGHVLLLKGGESWCPYSRASDQALDEFAQTVERHEDELDDAQALLERVRFASIEMADEALAASLCAELAMPAGLPVPWIAAVWNGRRMALDRFAGSSLWRCESGVLIGAAVLTKTPGSLALLCEALLAESESPCA